MVDSPCELDVGRLKREHDYEKIFVSEAPDPPVGKWREVTNPQPTVESLDGWKEHIAAMGNETRITTRNYQGARFYVLEAKKIAP